MKNFIIYALLLLSFGGCQPRSRQISKLYEFDLQNIAQKYDSVCKIEKNSRFGKDALIYQPKSANNSIVISGIGAKVDWSSAKYLICEVYNSNDCDAIVKLDFYKNTNYTNYNESKIGVSQLRIGDQGSIAVFQSWQPIRRHSSFSL